MSVQELANLTKRDLLLDQQLETISKKSLPSKEMEDTPPTNLINTIQSDINLKDMAIEEQLQKISRNAIKDVLGWKPTTVKSDVTNEMIQEYQDEIANSFYDDPLTGKRLKYVPVASDLTLEVFEPQIILTDAQIENIRTRIRTLTAARTAAERQIVDQMEELEYLKSTVEFKEEKRKKGFYSKEFLIANPDLAQLPTESFYLNYVQRKENEIYGYKARIFEIDGELGQLQDMIRQNEVAKKENQAQKDKVGKINYRLLKDKSEELNLLNRGQLNLVRQPNETDEEFRQRLVDVGQVEFDEAAIEQAAGRRALVKFKTNMKEITRNNTLIENIAKSVEPSRLFLYNKFFQAIKTKFDEVYGKATFKDNDYPELINIFDNIIGKVNLSNAKETPVIPEQELSGYSTFQEISKPKPLSLLSPEDQYLELLKASQAIGEPEYSYLPDQTPAAEARFAEAEPIEPVVVTVAPKAGRKPLLTESDNPYELKKEVLLERYKDQYAAITGGGRGKELNSSVDGKPADIGTIFDRLLKKKLIQERKFYEGKKKSTAIEGEGIKLENIPKLAQFGKIMINPYALYYQNTLIISTNGKNHLTGFRNVKVSDDFVSIIMKILNGGDPTHKELQKLDLAEKELYDNVIHLAHLHKKVDHNLAQTRQAMKHRFELLNGEIGAGNTNKMLKKELADLVHKMAYAGMISHHQRFKFVKSL
jgi:hypothetical protein